VKKNKTFKSHCAPRLTYLGMLTSTLTMLRIMVLYRCPSYDGALSLGTACYQQRAKKTGLWRESTLSLSRIIVCEDKTPVSSPPHNLCFLFARRRQQEVSFCKAMS
jgi:hypothetical protein